jgi:hypothetical protein
MTLDLDAIDDPYHGQQEERFFHGLLWLLLLPAPLRILRPPLACRQAAPLKSNIDAIVRAR